MTTRLQAPEGTNSACIEGHDYTVDEDGFIDVENGEHVPILELHGFHPPVELAVEDEPVFTHSTEIDDSESAPADLPPNNAGVVPEVVYGDGSDAPAEQAPVDETVEDEDEVVELEDPGECPDFSKFANRDALVEYLAAHGVPDADPDDSRADLEQACADRHAALVLAFEQSQSE